MTCESDTCTLAAGYLTISVTYGLMANIHVYLHIVRVPSISDVIIGGAKLTDVCFRTE